MNNAPENNKPQKVVGIVLNVILWLFLVFAFVMMILAFTSASNEYGVPIIGDKVILTVQSDSMSPTFEKGDMLIARALDNDEKNDLQVGDIITFFVDLNGDGEPELNTHRIISESAGTFRTRGDNTPAEDDYIIFKDKIVATWKEGDTRIGGLGAVIGFLQSRIGFLLVVIIPLVLLFIYEIIRLVLMVSKLKSKDKRTISEAEKEAIRKQAVEEYMRSIGETGASGAAVKNENAEVVSESPDENAEQE